MIIEVQPIKSQDVQRDYLQVTGIMEYWRWLAEQDPSLQVTAAQVAGLYQEFVIKGRFPSEVLEDLGLPAYPGWS